MNNRGLDQPLIDKKMSDSDPEIKAVKANADVSIDEEDEYDVEDKTILCCIHAQVYKKDGVLLRTVLPSAPINLKNILICLIGFALVMVAEVFYKKPALDFTLSPAGIPATQARTSPAARKFWSF